MHNAKERDSETVSSSGKGKRKSIKESNFAETHAKLLKPIYKFYQAMHLPTTATSLSGTHLIVEDAFSLVQMHLDAARECHSREIYTRFKKAVEAELIGSYGSLRY